MGCHLKKDKSCTTNTPPCNGNMNTRFALHASSRRAMGAPPARGREPPDA